MALSCLLGRVSSSVLKGHVLKTINNEIIKPSATVYMTRQQLHFTSSGENRGNKLLTQKYNLLPIAQKFSTSQALLSDHKGHDHSKLWTLERALAFLLLPAVPAALMCPGRVLDTALALMIVLHTHFGLEAIVIDYIRPIIFGNVIPKIGLGLLYVLSIVTLAGLLNLIYNDAGLANTLLTMFKK